MNQWVAWLIGQTSIMILDRLRQTGKYDSLTEAEARAELARLTGNLSTELPSPEELEKL